MTEKTDFFEPGQNCWQVAKADRFGLMIDGANYYGAVRKSLLKAKRTVFLVGWDIDSRMRLHGEGTPDDGAPEALKDFLVYLTEQNPDLRIHVLLWDFSVLYALERDPVPVLNLSWSTPSGIEVCLDDIVPLGASHHQKIVIIDGKLAFCGGMDLAVRRWDTREHRAEEPQRVDPTGKSYGPYHDMQAVLDGPAAEALCEMVTSRWEDAACKTPEVPTVDGDPWPDGVPSLFEDTEIAISRTIAPMSDRPSVREVETLFLDMIASAERCIYMENQFFTADVIATALVERLQQCPDLEVVLISSKDPQGFLETHSMAAGRERFMSYFERAELLDRVRLVHPVIDDGSKSGEPVHIHAKFTIIDDRFLRIGSANINNRSMGTDGECDLTIEGRSEDTQRTITHVRNDLLGEHLDMTPKDVAATIDTVGSVRGLIDANADAPRCLRQTDYQTDAHPTVTSFVQAMADPERPGDASQFVGDMLSARPGGTPIRGRVMVMIALALIGFFVTVWQLSPLAELTDPDTLKGVVETLRGDPWAYVILPLAFVVGSFLVFPITAMIAATAMIFPPAPAFAIALTGSMLSAVLNFWVGQASGKKFLRRLMGPKLNKISRRLGEEGLLTIVTLRIVPVAPFTLINLVSGASHIRLSSFVLGSLIGLAPGIATMTLVGNQLFEFIIDPTPRQMIGIAVALLIWIGVAWAARWIVKAARAKFRASRDGDKINNE